MSETSVPVSRTRLAALAIMAVLTVMFLSLAVTSFGAGDASSAVLVGVPADQAGNLGSFFGVALVLLTIPYVIAMILLAMRRPAGRDGTLLLAIGYGVVSLGVAGSTFFTVGSGQSWQGVLIGLANLAVAYLAWHRSTRNEIELVERRRAAKARA